MVQYDEHALFQIERRGIEKVWVEDAISNPDEIETRAGRRSFFKRLLGRHVMLRVVTPIRDPNHVITAYFDRTKPCA